MLTLRVVDPARVLATALTLAATAVVVAVLVRDPLPGETALLRAVHAEPGSAAERVWQAVSDATDLVPLMVVAGVGTVVLLWSGRRRSAVLLVAAVAVPWSLNPVLKALFARDRPDLWPLEDVSAYSLPSGHAAGSAALVAAVVAMLLPRASGRGRQVTVAVGAGVLLLVGAAQLALGRHYPSDLLVGWLWATAWVAVVLSLPAPQPPDDPVSR